MKIETRVLAAITAYGPGGITPSRIAKDLKLDLYDVTVAIDALVADGRVKIVGRAGDPWHAVAA